jgi:AcrR family transcriptional regulator
MPEKKTTKDSTTEEKIMEAARKVFTQKGYSGTRTRDIAEEANINLALLNYYFRSKEKLFEMIMIEKVQKLFGIIAPVLTDQDSTLEKKIELITVNYINMLMSNPDLPIFVLSEFRNGPERFVSFIKQGSLMTQSTFVKQLEKQVPGTNPIHFLMNIIGMIVFPFVGKPVFMAGGGLSNEEFNAIIEERKLLIPKWIKAMMKVK